jgi:hypothetical protein
MFWRENLKAASLRFQIDELCRHPNEMYRVSNILCETLTGDKAILSHMGQSFERIVRTKNREP